MYRGATFLVPSGPSGLHLYVVTTNPCPKNSFLLLSVSSIKDGKYHDPTCLFSGGEHEFITKRSFVVYGKPEQRLLSAIQKCLACGLFVRKADLGSPHFDRICDGISLSPHRQRWAVEHFAKYR